MGWACLPPDIMPTRRRVEKRPTIACAAQQETSHPQETI